jgi:two-component system, OmpR family, sensor histidine kinase SenX3
VPACPPAPESSAELRAAFDALATGVVVVGRQGTVLVRNHAATTLGGALHSDVLLHEALEAHLIGALSGEPRRQVLDLHGPPRRVVVIQGRALADGGALVTIDDVTERARLDAVRTDFVANISHELRTPVGALAVLAEDLGDADDPEVVERLSGKMVDEAHRVARTIDDLLELSRIELGGEAVRDHVDASAACSPKRPTGSNRSPTAAASTSTWSSRPST